MRKTRVWMYVFLPFLYVAIIFGFVAFQFSKKSDSFTQSLGDLTISGKTSTAGEPAELVLRGRGLEFLFDATHYLQAEARDGTLARLRPLSWVWKGGNLVVSFQQGLKLVFEKSEAGGKTLRIFPQADPSLANIVALRIPFSPEGGARIKRGARSTLAEVTKDKLRILASVDGARDKIEADNNFLLTAGKSGFRPARLDPLAPGLDAEMAWLTLDEGIDAVAAEAALVKYWDRAYGAWNSAASFSSRLVDAWSREALTRGEFPRALGRIQDLLARDRKPWGFEAAASLGNIVELTLQQRRSIEAASSQSQPDWIGQGNLWRDARHYGPLGSSDRVKELLIRGKLPETAGGLLAVFQNLLALQDLEPTEAVTARVQEVLKALSGLVVRREGELFVQSRDGLLDLKSSLLLGRLWLTYSRNAAGALNGEAGAQLIAAVLARQDAAGKLPEFLVTQDGLVVRQEGVLLAEDVYSVVKPAASAEVDIPGWGPRAFVRSPGKVAAPSVTDAMAKFSFRFPAGSAEHIIIAGVPEFDHITLHGIRWRTDPQFQSYTDGWAYSAATKMLFVKIKHREDLEELIIHFQPEE